jgi:hypothetical protein
MVKMSAMLEWNEAEAKVEIEHERQTPKCHEKKKNLRSCRVLKKRREDDGV